MRIRPAVKRELPPDSSSGARSRTRIFFANSAAARAAHSAAFPPPTTITSYIRPRWRRTSELVAAHAAVDGDHGARDVAGERRSEVAHQAGDVLGLAVLAHRDIVLALVRAPLGRVVAQDLLAHDAPGRNRVDRDAVPPDLARQALGPRVHRRLGGERAVQPFGLGLAGDVDDAAPFAAHHLRQQPVRELALADEVERERLVPLRVGGFEREAPAAAG